MCIKKPVSSAFGSFYQPILNWALKKDYHICHKQKYWKNTAGILAISSRGRAHG
jgi:hypothetical protein